MAQFFIDTATGRVATGRQLIGAGIATETEPPPRPWLRIQGTGDASTMWYAVIRRRERGVFLGTLVLRPSDHQVRLPERGWGEASGREIGSAGWGGRPDDRG